MEGVFAFLDVLLGGAALIVKAHHPVRLHWQAGDDEADLRKQIARVPFDLGDNTAFLAPGRRLIVEILVDALDLGERGAADVPRQPMRDLLTQDVFGRQSDGVKIARFFQPLVNRRIGKYVMSAHHT